MGQYSIVVNIDKEEYLLPHRLGCGLKFCEHSLSSPGVNTVLLGLLMEDVFPHPGGSWSGDHIVLAGDYADDNYDGDMTLYEYANENFTDVSASSLSMFNNSTLIRDALMQLTRWDAVDNSDWNSRFNKVIVPPLGYDPTPLSDHSAHSLASALAEEMNRTKYVIVNMDQNKSIADTGQCFTYTSIGMLLEYPSPYMLLSLLIYNSHDRGGGDLHGVPFTMGPWSGDRITIVKDKGQSSLRRLENMAHYAFQYWMKDEYFASDIKHMFGVYT